MARIRTIKPEFPQSESMGRVSRDARLLFVLLWTIVDDAGRARGSSRMLASLLYPYDDDAPGLMDGWLQELAREDCIRRYEFEGSTFIEVVKWLKHQKIDKPSQSRLPAFDEGSPIFAKPREGSATDLVPGPVPVPRTKDQRSRTEDTPAASPPLVSKRQGTKSEGRDKIATKDLDADFEIWFAQFPNKNGPDAARTRYSSVRRAFRATAAELLQGAMRYSHDMTGTDPKYIKTAKNWLNDGDWKNPPRRAPLSTDGAAEPGYGDFLSGTTP